MLSKITKEDGIVTTQLEEDNCPVCGEILDAATGVDGQTIPNPGDISICAYCAALLEFDENLKLKTFSDEDLKKLSKEELDDISFAQEFVKKQRGTLH